MRSLITLGLGEWSVDNGTLIVGQAFTAQIGAGGRVLIAGGTDVKQDGMRTNSLGLLIRQPNP